MHLLEAFLALFEATGAAQWRARAEAMLALFHERFRVGDTVREYFDEALRPLPGRDGERVEPGHLFEWSWLLRQSAKILGDPRHAEAADGLYDFAVAHGIDRVSGGVIDEIDPSGKALKRSRRIWPQAEAIKAHAARFEAGDADAALPLAHQIESLMRHHFKPMPVGAWVEHLQEDGSVLRDDLPGSTPYHLIFAALEAVRIAPPGPPAGSAATPRSHFGNTASPASGDAL